MRASWWWIDRWRKSTAYTDMTLAQQGAYRNLLDELWLRDGVLPNNDKILAKISGDPFEWDIVKDAVMARFVLTDEGWRNTTHDEIMYQSKRNAEKQARYRSKQGNICGNVTDNIMGDVTGTPSPSPSPITVYKTSSTTTTIFSVWETCCGRPITGWEGQELSSLSQDYSDDLICGAIKEAAANGNQKVTIRYITKILARWKVEGRKNGNEPEEKESQFMWAKCLTCGQIKQVFTSYQSIIDAGKPNIKCGKCKEFRVFANLTEVELTEYLGD